jgi:trans-aconitate methyltransferase
MTPEESGLWLLDRLRRQLSLLSLARTHLLDFGCGVRFTQALINRGVPIGSYTGIDCFAEMIHFLRSAVLDRRFRYYVFDAYNPMYNPQGKALTASTPLPWQRATSMSLRYSR